MDEHSRHDKRRFIPILIPIALATAGFIVMALWNALMPEIFKLPEINFWQAVGLFILSRLLLGGFGGGGGRRPGPFRRHDKRPELLHHLRERWEQMTPEQREKMRRNWRRRWDVDLDDELIKGTDLTKRPPEAE